MEQHARTATLDAFRRGDITFLAASDVAARGLDIPDVSHVFNFDVPVSPEDYVHRVGRTGRAGREGFAATIVTPADIDAVRAIEKLCREKIEWLDGEPAAELLEGGRGRRRRGRGRTSERSEVSERPAKVIADRRNVKQRGVSEVAEDKGRAGRSAQSDRKSNRSPSPVTPFPAPQEPRSRPAPAAVAAAPSRGRGRSGGQRGEEVVVGLGDHVPAFLMTPVRRAK
jgi:superfamily II DNA/RNA helicase